uniref:Hypothetical conserved protein n=1 Tax=Acetithermum autotrophicum TaxID=1446466 RepID=H5SVF5_ACEAU|nr:hypothetical conserved protein [Candidatus Acetothermum autotrophicum]
MLRVVLDSNIWVATILKPHGYYARVIKQIAPHVDLFTAEEILAEVREASLRPEKMRKYNLTKSAVTQGIASIRAFAHVVSRLPRLKVITEDPDDDVILACAVRAKADYLITYDPHLLKLKEYQGIKILKPSELLAELRT